MVESDDFIMEFVEEASGHVEQVERELLRMEVGEIGEEGINAIFRSVHSIKGTAGFFALSNIVRLSHTMENLFGEIRSGGWQGGTTTVDVMLRANDCLKSMIGDVQRQAEVDISLHVAEIESLLQAGPAAAVQDEPEARAKTAQLDVAEAISRLPEAIAKVVPEMDRGAAVILEEALRHGHRIYRLRLSLIDDLEKNGVSPMVFFKRLQSIGNFIACESDTSEVGGLDSFMTAQIYVSFLFTSILEPDLVVKALRIGGGGRLTEIAAEGRKEAEPVAQPVAQPIAPKDPVAAGPSEVGEASRAAPGEGGEKHREDSIKVNIGLLNKLLNLASEMVLGRNQLLRLLEGHRKQIAGLDAVLQNIDSLTTEMQGNVMQTRMQPVGNVFNKFPRVCREISKKLGKEVELVIQGADVELDKSIIEALADPLTHLVRNSLDHGLELPEEREAMGKDRQGTVILRAYHEGGQVNIDIVDDGRGINPQKIKEKAWSKGLLSEAEFGEISDQEAVELVFRPGFSTAENLSDLSGRGVGMDVVKTNVEKLSGTVSVVSTPGAGSVFRLTLPLTVAIISSLIIEIKGQRFALPRVNLQEMVRVKASDADRKIEYIMGAPVLRLRGHLLPLVDLSEVVWQQGTDKAKAAKVVSLEERRGVRNAVVSRILVLKSGARQFGVLVDRVHDDEEILVKPLPRYLKTCQAYSGITIMGDGKVALILDADGILNMAGLRFLEEHLQQLQQAAVEQGDNFERQNILLFKCSGAETFALDMGMISRVEEVQKDRIERIGEREYIQYCGEALRVVRPENYLPVSKAADTGGKMYVIIPKHLKKPTGLLIQRIEDSMESAVQLDSESIKAKGLLGSAIIGGRLVLFINVYDLLELVAPEDYHDQELRPQQGDGRRVLVVEDTPFFARMERDYLESVGYEVVAAANGKEAMGILRDHKIDLIVSDIEMPVMDGIELIKTVRADRELCWIPAIAVTTLSTESQVKKGIESGYDFYESKLNKISFLEKVKLLAERGREAV